MSVQHVFVQMPGNVLELGQFAEILLLPERVDVDILKPLENPVVALVVYMSGYSQMLRQVGARVWYDMM